MISKMNLQKSQKNLLFNQEITLIKQYYLLHYIKLPHKNVIFCNL